MGKGSKIKRYLALLAKRSLSGINMLEDSILGIGVFLIAAFVTMEAVMRYTMKAMPPGLEETALLIAAWMYFIGLAVAMRDSKHIFVTLIDPTRLSRRAQDAFEISTIFVSFAVCAAYSYVSIGWSVFVARSDFQYVPFPVTANIAYLSMAIGFTLASVYLLAHLIRRLRRL